MSNQTNAVKYYKVIKACAGLNVGDVVIKAKGLDKTKSAYHKLTDKSVQKVVYCICKKSLRKLQIKQGTPDAGDKILIINPYMTSGEYVLGDVIDVIKPNSNGVDIARSTAGTKWVAGDEYVIVMNWLDTPKKEMFGQFEQGTPVKVNHNGKVVTGTVEGCAGGDSIFVLFTDQTITDSHSGGSRTQRSTVSGSGWFFNPEDLTTISQEELVKFNKPVESHYGFKVGDKVVYTPSSGDKVFGVVQGFSYRNSPFVQFTKETDYSHEGDNGALKEAYTPLTTPTGYFVDEKKLQHFDAYAERTEYLASAREKANTEFTSIIDKMDALVK